MVTVPNKLLGAHYSKDMLGPRGAFDEDMPADDNDDEDLKSDPISQMDLTVRPLYILIGPCDVLLFGGTHVRYRFRRGQTNTLLTIWVHR
jgi:hypothetical protein